MERKIGEIFEHKKTVLKVVENVKCSHCYFYIEREDCRYDNLVCQAYKRFDNTSVIFVKQD